jgi:hypothetical protein
VLAGHGVLQTLNMQARSEQTKDAWVKSLRKLIHIQELHKGMEAPADDPLLSALGAKDRAKLRPAAAREPGVGKTAAMEPRKQLSLAVGAEYRMVRPTALHESAEFTSPVMGEYAAGDIVKALEMGFAVDPG